MICKNKNKKLLKARKKMAEAIIEALNEINAAQVMAAARGPRFPGTPAVGGSKQFNHYRVSDYYGDSGNHRRNVEPNSLPNRAKVVRHGLDGKPLNPNTPTYVHKDSVGDVTVTRTGRSGNLQRRRIKTNRPMP